MLISRFIMLIAVVYKSANRQMVPWSFSSSLLYISRELRMATIRPLRTIILTLCTISAVVTTLWASPVPVETALMNHSRSVRSTSEAEAKGELASLLTGVFVVTKVLVSVYSSYRVRVIAA